MLDENGFQILSEGEGTGERNSVLSILCTVHFQAQWRRREITQKHGVNGEVSPLSVFLPVSCEFHLCMTSISLNIHSQCGHLKALIVQLQTPNKGNTHQDQRHREARVLQLVSSTNTIRVISQSLQNKSSLVHQKIVALDKHPNVLSHTFQPAAPAHQNKVFTYSRNINITHQQNFLLVGCLFMQCIRAVQPFQSFH